VKTNVLPILVIVLIFGCSKSERSCLEDYFKILQDSILSEGIITSIRFCKEDSLDFMIPLIRGAVRAISNDEVYKDLNNCVSSCLDHIPITARDGVLVLAFRKYLNSETVDINQTYVDVAEIYAGFQADVKAREIAQRLDLQEIVLNNANMAQVGDRLELVFHLDAIDDDRTIIYGNYPASLYYSIVDDTLVMHKLNLHFAFPYICITFRWKVFVVHDSPKRVQYRLPAIAIAPERCSADVLQCLRRPE
jgi:hypothetical protein